MTVAHTSDWSTLVDQFGEFKPHFILSVPRVFEKVYNAAKQKAHDGGKDKIFDMAARPPSRGARRRTRAAPAWRSS